MTGTSMFLAAGLAAFGLVLGGGCKDRSSGQAQLTDLGASHPKYKPRQAWHYRTRAGEEQSTLTILKVERSPKTGTIVHVGLAGLRMKNPRAPRGETDTASHLPFTEKAIDDSVTTVATPQRRVPAYLDGYNTWRKAFDAGEGGTFTTTVAATVDILERAMTNATPEAAR